MKKLLSVTLFNLLSVSYGFCQHYIFTNYSINDGLSQSVVNCIFQDSRGYIWIGTQNGLNRFNGETFEVYTTNPADSSTLSNNWIYAITEDKQGNLYIGTKGGLNKYLYTADKFRRITWDNPYEHDVGGYCYDVLCLDNGNIVINTPPVLTLYNPREESFIHFQSTFEYNGAVLDVKIPVLQDSGHSVWMGSTSGLAEFSFNTETFSYYPFKNRKGIVKEKTEITALFRDSKNDLWAGTTTGLYRLNPVLSCFEEVLLRNESFETDVLQNSCIRTIIEEKEGNLLLGTEGGGLLMVKPEAETAEILQNYTAENSGISHNIIQALLIDQSENLWAGTLSGISKADLKPKKFNLYRKSNDPNSVNLLGNVIAALFKDDDGMVWVGNWGQGLNLLNRQTMEVEHFSTQHEGNHHLPNDFVHVIFKDSDKNIWLGTRNGLLIYEKTKNRFLPYREFYKMSSLPSFSNVRIYMIIQDRFLNYWIATQNGLYKINLAQESVEAFRTSLDEQHRLSANLVYCLLEDSEGLIWIATINGLDVYDPLTKQMKHFKKNEKGLTDDFIISLCEDKKGRIWTGTSTYINIFNKQDSLFTWYGKESGIPNNNIFEIIKDKNNDMWITTGKGLCKYNEKNNSFRTFTLEDGLQSLEFNLRAAYLGEDGEILVGGMNGFNAFYPDSISRNPYLPNLVFTSFFFTRDASNEYINPNETEKLVLDYNITSFTIEFAALEYTNPKKNLYAYQMQGISDAWTEIGNRKFVPFSGLPPGDYTFKVRGSNSDGIWNNNEISIGIVIVPPWWRSTFAYIVYIVLTALIILIYIKFRINKLQHDKRILEQKVHERTLQIEEQNRMIVAKNLELKELNLTKDKLFSIIGHDLGNQFNIILGYLELLVSENKGIDSGKKEVHINNVFTASKHAFDLLENLLTWARMQTNSIEYNPQNIDVHTKLVETNELFKSAAGRKNIATSIRAVKGITVYADENMFSTVLRNLMANAVKFTRENGRITISAAKKGDYCEFSVKDNGVGISEDNLEKIFRIDSKHKTPGTNGEKGTGLGLILCKEFIEKQNGRIWVESKTGRGSKFIFILPVNDNWRSLTSGIGHEKMVN